MPYSKREWADYKKFLEGLTPEERQARNDALEAAMTPEQKAERERLIEKFGTTTRPAPR
jgi:hypothetical protein